MLTVSFYSGAVLCGYAADVLDRIPAERRRDVILFDPSDPEPVGFNLIGGSGESDLIVDHLVSELRHRYGAAGLGRTRDWWTAQLATWRDRLDLVVSVDADDPTLLERIRARGKDHAIRTLDDADARVLHRGQLVCRRSHTLRR